MRLPLLLLACTLGHVAIAAPLPDPLPKAPEPIEPILRLQIFLDGQLFGPGKVDGRPGEFTSKALQRYQLANNLPQTEVTEHTLDLTSVGELYTTYTIRAEDWQFIGTLPSGPAAQSKRKYLPYSSMKDFITEKFHCSPDLLDFINQPANLNKLKTGDTVKVPNVTPFLLEDFKPEILPEKPEFTNRLIKIDTNEKILDLYEGEKLLASLPITPGSGSLATPPGTWKIINMVQMPTFRWDNSVLKYGVRSSNFYQLPIGPRNPVGIMWIGLNRAGIGIHGTNNPQTIGRASSHGCMRTANWDVARLSKMITKGMTVEITGPAPTKRPVYVSKKTPSTSKPSAASRPASPPPQPAADKKRFRWFWQR